MKTTIREISRQTGFSSATVSNALSGKKGVRPETQAYIMETAQAMGYYPDEKKKKIRFIIFRATGMVTDDMTLLTPYLDGAQKECQRHGYEMAVHYLDRKHTDFRQQLKTLIRDQTDFLIVIGAELEKEDEKFFREAGNRMLLLHYWSETLKSSAILMDHREGIEMVIRYLAGKGHTRIGYLKGVTGYMESREKETGYYQGMKKQGLSVNEADVISLRPGMELAYEDMKRFLQKATPLPTALIAESDDLALGAMKALQEADCRIPEDISIVGFGDLPFSQVTTPRLSSLRYPKQLIGTMAVRRILEMQNEEEHPRVKILICPELVERESVVSRFHQNDGGLLQETALS